MSTKSKQKMIPFSFEDDEKLVECVAEYPSIYDSGDAEYKDQRQRENIWEKISLEIKRTVGDCKKRWRSIRGTYMKQRKIVSGSTGSAAKTKSKWPLLEHLNFLNTVSYERNSEINDSITDLEAIKETNSQEHADVPSDQESQVTFEMSSEDATSIGTVKLAGEKRKSYVSYSFSGAGKRRNDKNDALIKVFQKRSEQRDTMIQNLCSKTSNIPSPSSNSDAVTQFLTSLAMTINTFPPDLIIEAKSKIFAVVTELELQCLRRKEQHQYVQSDPRPSTSHSQVSSNVGRYYSHFASSDLDGDSDYTML